MELNYTTVLIAFGFFISLAIMYWAQRKYPVKEPKNDPVYKGIFLSFLLWGILFLAEGIGYFEKGWNQNHFYIHLIIAFAIVSIFLIVAYRKKPLYYEKQKAIVEKYILLEYKSEKYVGEANIAWLMVYKI